MTDGSTPDKGGWEVGQSIALELDVVLSVVQGYFTLTGLPEDAASLMQSLPSDWTGEASRLLGQTSHMVSILGYAAGLAGVVNEGNYDRATQSIREMTIGEALDRVSTRAKPYGLKADVSLPPPERLSALWLDLTVALYKDAGFKFEQSLVSRAREDISRTVQILRDGGTHTRFWHWLDRLYYGYYNPWRQARIEAFDSAKQRVVTALGAGQHFSSPPDTSWLPEINPVRRFPELESAVSDGRLKVFFWVEPFGLSDLLTLEPGWVIVSFAEPGALYSNFRAVASDIAGRTRALADPTRLIILRMIRNFSLINTEMAKALDLSRPTVSVHAKILREAGLIESYQEGRQTRHRIVRAEVLRLLKDLKQFLDIEEG